MVRHYTRLSQMVLANNVVTSLGLGTTTMKYNPIINELLSRSPKLTELHPDQDDSTMQGILELIYRFGAILAEASRGWSGSRSSRPAAARGSSPTR